MSHYKPYPAYRDSGVKWIGQVPEHWEIARIKRHASIRTERRSDVPANATYVGLEDVEAESGQYKPTSGNSRQTEDSTVGIFYEQDVLYGKLRPYLRKAIVAEMDGACSTEFLVLKTGNTLPRWLQQWLLTPDVTQQIEAGCEGAKMPRADWEHVGSIEMPTPSHEEQIQVISAVDRETARIDALITKKTRFIELLKEKRQALITHAVTKGLDPNVAMKDSGVEWIGVVPAHWSVAILKRFVVFQRGHDLPSDTRVEGTVPVVSSGGYSGTHNVAIAKAPGIVTGRYGSLGEFTFVEEDYWPLNTALYSIELHNNDHRFVWYLLQNISDLFLLYSAKAAVPGIDRNDIHEIYVAAPQHDEQRQIAKYLDEQCDRINAITEKTQRSIDLLKERRAAFITAAVTGQIDLRESA